MSKLPAQPPPVNENTKLHTRLLNRLTKGGKVHTYHRVVLYILAPVFVGASVDLDRGFYSTLCLAIGVVLYSTSAQYYRSKYWEERKAMSRIGVLMDDIKKHINTAMDAVDRCDFCSGRRKREIHLAKDVDAK